MGDNKAGWYANCTGAEQGKDTVDGSRITFRVRIHPTIHGRVMIKYVRSWNPEFGRVQVRLLNTGVSKQPPTWVLDGHHDSPYTLANFDVHDLAQFDVKRWDPELEFKLMALSPDEIEHRNARLKTIQNPGAEASSVSGSVNSGLPTRGICPQFRILAVITC